MLSSFPIAIRPLSCLITLSLITTGCDFGEKPAGNKTVSQADGPKIEVPEAEHPFGLLAAGQTGKHTFKIKNVGTAPLKLKLFSTSCTCTLGNLKNNEVSPGETADVEVSWKLADDKLKFRESAVLETNDPNWTYVELTVVGDIVSSILLNPRAEWILPQIQGEKSEPYQGLVYSRTLPAFKITKLTTLEGLFDVSSEPMSPDMLKKLQATTGYVVTVKLKSIPETRSVEDFVVVETDAPDTKPYHIQTIAEKERLLEVYGPDWSAAEGIVSLGRIIKKEGRKSKLSVFIKGGPETIEMKQVGGSPDFLKATVTQDPNFKTEGGTRKKLELIIEIAPGACKEARDDWNLGRIDFETNHPERKKLSLSVRFDAVQ